MKNGKGTGNVDERKEGRYLNLAWNHPWAFVAIQCSVQGPPVCFLQIVNRIDKL